jgi:transcription initiation factor IIE alpha subunit
MSTPTSVIKSDEIWFKDVYVLFALDRVTEFFPSSIQTLEERMNAIARLGLYITILIVVYKRDLSKAIIFPIILLVTYAIYKNYTKETFDSEGVATPTVAKKEIKPTLNNPFMNTLMNDYQDNPTKSKAPTYYQDTKEAEDLREDIKDKFTHNLYKDLDDAFEKNNSDRQFYTCPNTEIPSNQEKFLEFLYGDMANNCKSDTQNCKPFEDVRARPFQFPNAEENPTSSVKVV